MAVFPFNLNGTSFLLVYGLSVVAAIVFCWIWYHVNNGFLVPATPDQIRASESLHWTKLALLTGGKQRLVQTALLSLTQQGVVHCDGNGFLIIDGKSETDLQANDSAANAVYEPILDRLRQSEKPQSLATLSLAISSIATRYETELREAGHLRQPSQRTRYQYMVTFIGSLLLSVGIARCVQGITNDRPIGFLVMEMMIGALLFVLVYQQKSHLTAHGKSMLQRAEAKFTGPALRSLPSERRESTDALPYLAMLGPLASAVMFTDAADSLLYDTLYEAELQAMRKTPTSSSWASSDTGDSSWDFGGLDIGGGDTGGGDAGCGGGCGGCGGCGG